jgi:hypothetical protein
VAYNRKKILAYGGAGIVLAIFFILVFMPTQVKISVNPSVALQEIPDYGFQIVKISEEQVNIIHLNITLDGFEIMQFNGDWTEIEISEAIVSFNLLHDQEVAFKADVEDLENGNYTAIRFLVVQGLEFTNSTLNNGEVISPDVPYNKVKLSIPMFEINKGTESIHFKLRTASGFLSNYILPQFHLTIGTMKIEITAS